MSPLPYRYRPQTATDRVAACFARIDALEGAVRAWALLDRDGAREAAAALDAEAAAGRLRGPLHGMPIGVKDLFDVRGLPTRAGSASRADAGPATDDAPLIAALRAAGCIVIGKTHTTEFAFLDPTVTGNPFDTSRTPGGSSSGSGAAVGAGMVPLALGTQTVGSVCRPAAYCGAAAFKPTTGSTRMDGVVAFASSYDTAGFLASRLDVALDAWQATLPAADADADAAAPLAALPLAGLRFAFPTDPYFGGLDLGVAGALAQVAGWLVDAGAERVDVALDVDLAAMRGLQRTVMFHEAARAHAALLRDDAVFARLGRHWREGLALGAGVSVAQADDARGALAAISRALLARLDGVDVTLLPTTQSVAPSRDTTGDPGLILPWTIAATPLTVLPVGLAPCGLPTAVMLAGAPGHDRRLAAISLAVEAAIRAAGGGYQGVAPA